MATQANILGGAPITTNKFVATAVPGFSGDGSGLTNLPTTAITLALANAAVITNGAKQLATEAQLANTRGGTGLDTSGFTGVAKVTAGTWSVSQVQTADIAPGAVLSANIGAGTITSTNIGTGAVSNANLATLTTAGLVANSATTATSANTASAIVARDATGNFTANNVTVTQLIETVTNGQSLIQSSSVSTTNLTAATLFTLVTAKLGTNGTTYLVTANISLGDTTLGANTGSYQFQFKAKNTGPPAIVSGIVNQITILDGTLSGTAIALTVAANNVTVQVTGLGATVINWVGQFNITQVNF